MTDGNKALLIVGGGRWARVYLSILARIQIPVEKIVVVSQHGGESLAAALAEANARRMGCFACVPSLGDALAQGDVYGAVIANAARDHVRTALPLLKRGVPVLLEKPAALRLDDAERLIVASAESGAALVPALVMRFCHYLPNFAKMAHEALGLIRSIDVRWTDPAGEARYGEIKGFDAGLGVVEEMAPHIASLLTVMLGDTAHRIDEARFTRGGLAVKLTGRWNDAPFTVLLERQAAERERLIVLGDDQAREARLDFSIEPGTIRIGSTQRDADPDWSQRPSPLTQQILKFIEIALAPPQKSDLDAIRSTTEFTARAAELVREAQRNWLGSPAGQAADRAERVIAMRELLAPLLCDAGRVAAGDNEKLAAQSEEAMRIMVHAIPQKHDSELTKILEAAGITPAT